MSRDDDVQSPETINPACPYLIVDSCIHLNEGRTLATLERYVGIPEGLKSDCIKLLLSDHGKKPKVSFKFHGRGATYQPVIHNGRSMYQYFYYPEWQSDTAVCIHVSAFKDRLPWGLCSEGHDRCSVAYYEYPFDRIVQSRGDGSAAQPDYPKLSINSLIQLAGETRSPKEDGPAIIDQLLKAAIKLSIAQTGLADTKDRLDRLRVELDTEGERAAQYQMNRRSTQSSITDVLLYTFRDIAFEDIDIDTVGPGVLFRALGQAHVRSSPLNAQMMGRLRRPTSGTVTHTEFEGKSQKD